MKNEELVWQPGIPEYKEEDLMTRDNIHYLGIRMMTDFLESNGYTILSVEENYGSNPSFIVEKDNSKIAVMLMVDIAPNIPQIRSDKYGFIDFAKSNEMLPYFAGLSVCSADKERSEKSLALIDDDFRINHLKFEEVDNDMPKINTEEYYKYKLAILSNIFLNKNYKTFDKVLSDNCELFNNLTKDQVQGIENIKIYLEEYLERYAPNGYAIVKTVGMFGEFISQELTVQGIDEVIKNARVKVLQDPDKIMSIVEYKENIVGNNIPAIMLNCDFDKQGEICNVFMGDPRHFNY